MPKVDASQRVEGGPTKALQLRTTTRTQREIRTFPELLRDRGAGDHDRLAGQPTSPLAHLAHLGQQGGENAAGGMTAVAGCPHPSGDELGSAPRRSEWERERAAADEVVFFCDGGLLPSSLPLPVGAAVAAGPSATPASTTASFNELVSRLVTSVAMGGDARRGSMRLELGGRGSRGSSASGSAQGSLLVHAEGDEVEIEIHAPPGVDTTALERNVQTRLARKGVRVTRFDVT